MFFHNKQPQLQPTHYAEYDMFQHSAPTGSALGMQQSAGISRKRTIHEAYDEDIEGPLCSGYTLGKIVGMKKRSERPLETHIHASTLRRLFEAAQTQQHLLTGSRGSLSSARDLSCEDCDNVIVLDEYTSDPESYLELCDPLPTEIGLRIRDFYPDEAWKAKAIPDGDIPITGTIFMMKLKTAIIEHG
ncbi:hypothetical protein V1527DRAFT_490941 [Lipomyces starkeyi]